jgi:hypothetical protein
VRDIALGVRFTLGAIEDIIRTEVDETRSPSLSGACHHSGGDGIDDTRFFAVLLTAIHVCESGAIHQNIEIVGIEESLQSVGISHIEFWSLQCRDFVMRPPTFRKRSRQASASAKDEDIFWRNGHGELNIRCSRYTKSSLLLDFWKGA